MNPVFFDELKALNHQATSLLKCLLDLNQIMNTDPNKFYGFPNHIGLIAIRLCSRESFLLCFQ